MVRGRKVVGSAQVRVGAGMLQHGSILLDDDQRRVAALTLGAPAPGMETPLNAALPRPVSAEEVADALLTAARAGWPGGWTELDPALVLERAARHLSFFSSDEWTWRR
jgi:Lipoate-protein ligase A